MDSYQDPILLQHLESWIDELERKLAYPKNDWLRKEQLQSELAEVKQRLAYFSRPSRGSRIRDRLAYNPSPVRANELNETPSRPFSPKLEINYC